VLKRLHEASNLFQQARLGTFFELDCGSMHQCFDYLSCLEHLKLVPSHLFCIHPFHYIMERGFHQLTNKEKVSPRQSLDHTQIFGMLRLQTCIQNLRSKIVVARWILFSHSQAQDTRCRCPPSKQLAICASISDLNIQQTTQKDLN